MVTVDEPRQAGHTGGEVAAPVFAAIGEAAMRYLGVIPTKALASSTVKAAAPAPEPESAPRVEELRGQWWHWGTTSSRPSLA